MKKNDPDYVFDGETYTDQEINILADWCESLTIAQLMFIKDMYMATLQARAQEIGQVYEH